MKKGQLTDPGVSGSERSTIRASAAAGAGTGTLLVLFANNLPDSHPWKKWLVLLAPSASISIGALYSLARRTLYNYLNHRELEALARQAKKTLLEALQNPSTSEEHRVQLRYELEQLEVLLVRADVERIKALTKSR